MTRRIRLRWRRTAVYTAAALVLTTDATLAAVISAQDRTAAVCVVAIVLGYFAVAAVLIAVAYGTRTAWLAATDRHRARRTPTGRPMLTAEAIAEERARADAEEQQHAEAMAAVAAERTQPQQPQTVSYTAVMPVVQTEPTWGFGPYSTSVVEPEQQPWTAAVSGTAGRHAGMPDSPMARYDYESARGVW